MNEVHVKLPIEPMPKLRPRFKIVRGKVFTHTPYETKAFENELAALYLTRAGRSKFESYVPLQVEIVFAMQMPKSFSKKKRAAATEGLLPHTVKPDLDNLTKAVLDGLNKIAWNDDAQIIALHVMKKYSAGDPYIEVYIKQLT